MADEVSLYEHDVDVDGWVSELQLALDGRGYSPGPIDGWFGDGTRRAVERFQTDHAGDPHFLTVDGVVGDATWAALRGRDPEPGGVNNPPHGDTRRGHGGGGGDGGGGGAAAADVSSAAADVSFVGPPSYANGTVTVSIDVTGRHDVKLTAYLMADGRAVAQSAEVAVSSSGAQHLPIDAGVSGTFELQVWAEVDATEHVVSEAATVNVG